MKLWNDDGEWLALPICQLQWPTIVKTLRDFVRYGEAGLSEWMAQLKSQLRDRAASNGAGEHAERIASDLVEKGEPLPILARRAMLLTIYGVYEHHVRGLCETAMKDGLCAPPLGNKRHLRDSRGYLEENVKDLKPSAFGCAWELLYRVREVRNVLAHCNGIIEPDSIEPRDVSAREFIRTRGDIDIDKYGLIVIKNGFCESLVEVIDAAMKDIFAALPTATNETQAE